VVENALEHDPALAPHYRKIIKLFAARSGAIAEGIARAKGEGAAQPAAEAKSGEAKAAAPKTAEPKAESGGK
jgi:hypothetical protein